MLTRKNVNHSGSRPVYLIPKIFYTALLIYILISATTAVFAANAVDEVRIKILPDGYEITVNYLYTIQYQSHTPNNPAKELYVQLKTLNFQTLTTQDADSLRARSSLEWDRSSGIPLQEITFEGGDPERPQMTFIFTEEVECDVHTSGDLRSLIVKVKTKQPPVVVSEKPKKAPLEKISEKAPEKAAGEISLPAIAITADQSLAKLMEEARDSLLKEKYGKAVQLYLKILETAKGPVKQQAQEMLGVARERNKQFAHAKAEYEKYLQEFPAGPDADRVRQRLAGLVTAAKAPKEKLKEAKRAIGKEKGKWSVQNYGNVSQFYFRDQTIPVGGQVQVNRSDLTSDLDWNSRWKSDDMDVNARFTGGHQQNFSKEGADQDSISAASVDMRSKKSGLYGRFGRQTLTTGGVLGRFDGSHMAVKLNPVVKLNTVFGYPVESSHQTEIKAHKRFYGVNFDFGTFKQKWDFNTFFINQDNYGLTDRRAVGGEARYFDPNKALFTLVDYDVFFNTLDIFLFNGHWTLPTKTTINLIYDYRKSPLLTLNNSIQGQGVDKLSDLRRTFTDDQLKQLAKDRTANSKTTTFGITQDIKQDLQLNTEISISELEGTISSGGVDGAESTGQDYTYTAQLIASNVLKQNDVLISGVSYSDTSQYNTYSLNLNSRYPLTQKVRLIPKFRFDYRTQKNGDDNRVTVRPVLGVDYSITKSTRIELEAGFEWLDEKASGIPQQSMETFISVGYRISF